MKNLYLAVVVLLLPNIILSQLTVTPNNTADLLVQEIIGEGSIYVPGTAVINCTYPQSTGIFDGTTSNIGLTDGVMLTTGNVDDFEGANVYGATSYTETDANGISPTLNDPDLTALQANAIYDVCILQFDVIPVCNTLQLNYVFASEEYPDYVCSSYNDAFGFFISGPGINGPFSNNAENIALVPGTSDYVAINSINSGIVGVSGNVGGCEPTGQNNTQFYTDNSNGTSVEFNGFTVPLIASSPVTPCETYHMKLVIGDAGDGIYDSGVFLAEAGLTCPGNNLTWNTIVDNSVEGCSSATFELNLDGTLIDPTEVTFTFLGSAQNGVDYNFESSHTFNPGEDLVSYSIQAIADDLIEGAEEIIIVAEIMICDFPFTDTLTLSIIDEPFADAGIDLTDCESFSLLAFDPDPYVGVWSADPAVVFSDVNNPNATATINSLGSFEVVWTVSIQDNCEASDTITLNVAGQLDLDVVINEPLCYNDFAQVEINNPITSTSYDWDYAGIYVGSDTGTGPFILPTDVEGVISVTVNAINGACIADSTFEITINSPIELNIVGFDPNCDGACNGLANVIPTGGTGSYSYLWQETNQSTPSILNLCEGEYHVSVTDENQCIDTASVILITPDPIIASFLDSNSFCQQSNGMLSVMASGGTINQEYNFEWTQANQIVGNTSILNNLYGDLLYQVTITDDNLCVLDTSFYLNDVPGFIGEVISTYPVSCFGECDGQAIVGVIGNGDRFDFEWFGPNGYNSSGSNMNDLCAGSYDIEITDIDNGCIGHVSLEIYEPELLTLVTNPDTTICIDGTANLTSNANGGTLPYSYVWDNNGVTINSQNMSVQPVIDESYSVLVIDANNCVSPSGIVQVLVLDSLQVTLTASQLVVCPDECVDVTVFPSGGVGSPFEYSFNGSSQESNVFNICPEGLETINMILSDGCETPEVEVEISLSVFDLPSLSILGPNESCVPLSTCLELVDTANVQSASWEILDVVPEIGLSNMFNPCFEISTPGNYSVMVSVLTNDGCYVEYVELDYLQVYDFPIADFSLLPNVISSANSEFEILNNSIGADYFNWYLDSVLMENGEEPNINLNEPGEHQIGLMVENIYGCTDSTWNTLTVLEDLTIYVPNCFTPNGDGNNDSFSAKGVGILPGTFEMYIYDRWGNKLFVTNDINETWNGIVQECISCGTASNREEAQIDVYVWKIRVKDYFNKEHRFVGHVSIIR